MNLAQIEADVKAGLAEVEHLLYTPQLQHPALEALRELVVAQIQAHLSGVSQSAVTLGNAILQQVEQTLSPPADTPK